MTGASVTPTGLGSAEAPEPFGLRPTGAIPSADHERIWLIFDPEADEPVTWADTPNPYAEYGEKPERATEYVRADRYRELVEAVEAAASYIAFRTGSAADAVRAKTRVALAKARAGQVQS